MSIYEEKVVAFIVARLNSSRFPAKQLRKIGPKPLLSWTIEHLKESKEIDEIVIATVAEKANFPLKQFASEHRIPHFWYQGDPNEVTSRLCAAAKKHAADICILISGDCPLVDGKIIDKLVNDFRDSQNKDFICLPPLNDTSHCMIQGVSIARRNAWELAERLSDKPELKEHHFPVFSLKSENFNCLSCEIDHVFYSDYHRLSVDTWADYCFFNELYNQLEKQDLPFTLENAIKYIQAHPEIKKINQHVYQRKVKEEIPAIAFLHYQLDSQHSCCEDDVTFNIETVLHIIESKGWPVKYLSNDNSLHKILGNRGIAFYPFEKKTQLFKNLPQIALESFIVIDNSSSQFNHEEIDHLISAGRSLIILGKAGTKKHRKVLELDSFVSNSDVKNSSTIVADQIVNYIENQFLSNSQKS